ncbi:uncharacterized protein LOC132256274 [Phlebotomus argentipes]|uniref:uncharacterized protein LOC132256274 n=1 Tax=Phlebotomus argentipes TaxID=94469 RepID=UPI0028937CB5|nr:uncharacterized protein LOC132256274 [Phlebotomus argentipes]
MVYKAILAKERKQNRLANVFCIPFSKLTDYKDALKVFKQKVVVYVDTEEVQEEFDAYENAIFIFKSTDNNSAAKICSLDDFSNEAREEFLQKEVEFQGCPVKVSLLTDNKDVLTEILQAFFDNNQQTLKFGTKLPVDDLPKYYIDRIFSISPRSVGKLREDDMVKEEDIYTPGENTIIQGLAGVGKSTTMLRIAQRTKQQKPCRFVQYIDLKTHSDILHFIKDKGIKISSTDAWEFTKINFLKINAESEKVHRIERLLVEAYLEEELPKIVIFLDGFDEISPLYSDQIIEIVEGLKLKKIQMFISSQKHLIQTIDKLKFELNYILEPYNNVMQRQFLRLYWGNILNTMIRRGELSEDEVEKQNIHVYTKKFFKMCYRSKLTDITPSIPLMLNILADHYAQECMEFCKRSNKKWSEKILEVDVLMIYDKIFQDNCRKFYRKTEEKQSNIFIKEKEVDVFAMVRQTHMEIAAKNLLPEFWKETENVNIERRMYEIYGRGFITGNKTGEYLFIYDTFKEFFAADWFTRKIFPADKIVDIELLKCLLKKDDKNGSQKMQFDRSLTSFIYRFILKRLQDVKEKVKLEEHQAEANQISDFILEFFHYAWFNREISQLEIVFDMAKTFCPNDKVRQICKSKKLLETIPFTSPLQLELTVKIYDHYLGPEETNAVFKERDMGKILNFIIKETNFQLFKEYTDLLISRKIVTHADNLPEKTFNHFRNYLRKQKVSSWMFVKKVLLWHYELLGTTEDDIFTLLDEVLKEEQFKDRLFLGHSLASFWDWKENDQNFMKTVCSRANASKEHYRFLYALNSITREDIFEGAMQMLKDEKCSFICHDGKSVLCHAFESNNSFIVEKLLNLLTKEEIEAQIKDEVCGGNSILKQCTKENHLCDIFITVILKIFGEETIHDFFTPIEDRKGKSLEINIKFLNTIFKKKIQVKKNLLEDCMTNLWIQVINKNAKLLHSIAKEANNVEIVKHVLNYVQKRPNGLLVAQLQAVDNDGNTPLHIAAQGNRTIFFDEVEKILPEWLLSELLYIRNKDKKDVFDCIYDNKDNPMSGEEYFQKYGVHKVSNSMELM